MSSIQDKTFRYIVERKRPILGYVEYFGPMVSCIADKDRDAQRLYGKPGRTTRAIPLGSASHYMVEAAKANPENVAIMNERPWPDPTFLTARFPKKSRWLSPLTGNIWEVMSDDGRVVGVSRVFPEGSGVRQKLRLLWDAGVVYHWLPDAFNDLVRVR